jgi:hypothetical protein
LAEEQSEIVVSELLGFLSRRDRTTTMVVHRDICVEFLVRDDSRKRVRATSRGATRARLR